MCFALHDICVLHPFSNLIFEIICSLRFAIPRPGIAGICIYIYMHIYIYFCLMLVYVHLYTSFHVEGERGGEILNLRFQCDNSLCLLKKMTIPGLSEQGYI